MLDNERHRIQELSRLYSKTGTPFHVQDQTPGAGPPARADATLNALNRLGLYRFGCTRSCTYLVLEQHKHVIAEATAPASISDRKRYRDSGIDFAGSSKYGQDSPSYTTNGTHMNRCDPHPQFYAEAPLRSPLGHRIGTYCIIDESRHTILDNSDVKEGLRDIAEAISQHLDNVHYRQERNKGARMMKVLSAFIDEDMDKNAISEAANGDYQPSKVTTGGKKHYPHTTMLPVSLQVEQPDNKHELGRRSISTAGGVSPCASRPQSLERDDYIPIRNAYDVPDADLRSTPLTSDIRHDVDVESNARRASTMVSVSDVPAISEHISALLARASSLIKEYLEVNGVVFFDTSRVNTRRSSIISTGSSEGVSGKSETPSSIVPLPALGVPNGVLSNDAGKVCETIGLGLDENTGLSALGLPEDLVSDMTARFPSGQVLQYPECTGDDLFFRLKDYFPDAESFLFLPLWDWNRSRWLAASLLWSVERGRFTPEDLHYLRVLGKSIIAEIAHIDSVVNEKAKSDFVSSISHELRSPLHGVLANTELLQSTDLQPSQRDMVKMVQTCGSTLLDTMNYLLDFAKINNLTTGNRKEKTSEHTDSSDLTATFDLDVLVEDVANSLYAGHQSYKGNSVPAGHRHSRDIEPQLSEILTVTIDIDYQSSWLVHSVSGAWRRIVMNLFGNALKFTKSGFIEITLSTSDADKVPNHAIAHLAVADSGCGISPDFLDNQIFTPFSQEDIFTEGAGLGLSIVHQLVTSLGGRVEIKSDVGIGTQVDVFIPIRLSDPNSSSTIPISIDSPPCKVCLVGFEGCHNMRNMRHGMFNADAKRKLALRRSLSSIVLIQPGWTVSFSDSLSSGTDDIAVLEGFRLKQAAANGPVRTGYSHVLVLGSELSSDCTDLVKDAEVVYVTQPIGPRKIFEALRKIHLRPDKRRLPPLTTSHLISQPSKTRRALSEAFASTAPASPPMAKKMSELYPSPEDQPPGNDVHVLIVDDNEINLKILESFMRKIGSSYETASNGLIAVEKYKKSSRRFDFILMDLSMPIMDGITASARIRDHEQMKGLPRTTIMAVTGVASSSMQQRAFNAGINDYLVKPLSLHELKRIMNVK